MESEIILPPEPASATTVEHIVDAEPPKRPQVPAYIPVVGTVLGILALIIVVAVVIGTVFGTFQFTSQRVNRSVTLTQQFSVGATPTLKITNAVGAVHIGSGPVGTVNITATKVAHGVSSDIAQRDLDRMTVTMTQVGDTITITTEMGVQSPSSGDRHIDLTITTPSTTSVDLTSQVGDITIDGLNGQMHVALSTGALHMSNVTIAATSKLSSDVGDLEFMGTIAPGVSLQVGIRTGSVKLALPGATAIHLDASTDIGSLKVNGWPTIKVIRTNVTGAKAQGDLQPNAQGTLAIAVNVGDIDLSAQ